MRLTRDDRITVAGHRGSCAHYPENTMESFEAAIREGADMIETDVRLTKDRVLVLMHDDKLDRTTDGSGRMCEHTYASLANVNAGKDGHFLPIPTLEELLKLLAGTNVMLNLEIKEYNINDNRENCEYCINESVRLCEAYGLTDRMVFNSFDAYVLDYIDRTYGGKYLLHGFYPYSIMRNVERNPDEYLYCACIFDDRVPEHYQYLTERGIEPWIGAGVKESEHLAACIKLGAKLITTNDPADIFDKLSKMKD